MSSPDQAHRRCIQKMGKCIQTPGTPAASTSLLSNHLQPSLFQRVQRKRTVLLNGPFVELMGGVEPPTYALRMRRSAIEPHQHIIRDAFVMRCFFFYVALHLPQERSRRRSTFPTLRQRRMIRRELY